MPVDNELYDRLGDTWWSDQGTLSLLRTALNPARFPWLRRTLTETLGRDLRGLRVLDVGCGGGLLAEEFARLGCRVTGVDPSSRSLEAARAHAAASGLEIDYRPASGERLPFENGSFAAVYCCDVLEHVDDVKRSILYAGYALKP
jgi:2-polyprenyl-6-hydroxyphenyl methylase / 3-demethylubiquinone-9 3-methyltransferase